MENAKKEEPPTADQKGSSDSGPGTQDVTSRNHLVPVPVCHPVPSHVLNRLSRFPPGSCPFPAQSGNWRPALPAIRIKMKRLPEHSWASPHPMGAKQSSHKPTDRLELPYLLLDPTR